MNHIVSEANSFLALRAFGRVKQMSARKPQIPQKLATGMWRSASSKLLAVGWDLGFTSLTCGFRPRPEVRSMNALRRLRHVSEVNEIHISGANNLFRTARRR